MFEVSNPDNSEILKILIQTTAALILVTGKKTGTANPEPQTI